MTYSLFPPSVPGLKAEARTLREERAEKGHPISHAAALEIIARSHGYRDWNTACAALPDNLSCPVTVGQKVSGHYLGQAFTGKVLALAALTDAQLYSVTIDFDEPVDVVTFESFSAFRKRINARIDPYGPSPDRTGNGRTQLELYLGLRRSPQTQRVAVTDHNSYTQLQRSTA